MAALFFASAQSFPDGGPGVPDWLTHGSAYAILGGLFCRALSGGLARPLTLRQALLAVALATGYGVTDELHQGFVPNRNADPWDVVKDCGGAVVGAGLGLALGRQRTGEPA
jgi:VanZ family protein